MGDSERIRDALAFIPANDRDTWVKMGMAIKSELGEDGFDTWDEWSQQDETYSASDARAVWKSIGTSGSVTVGTLFYEAKANGWHKGGTRSFGTANEQPGTRLQKVPKRMATDEAKIVHERTTAAQKATAIWEAAKAAPDDHAYLLSKGIKAHSIRVDKGALVIPVSDGRELYSLQFINGDGRKRFLADGRVSGCCYLIGDPHDATTLCIAEGFATGASIHEATGYPVAVAFNAGNLLAAAQALRSRFAAASIIICADDDYQTNGNPGILKATEAAHAVGGLLAIPHFGDSRTIDAKDFNDLTILHGAEAVKHAIANAKEPAIPEGQSNLEGAPHGIHITFRRMSDVQAKPIHWLWPGRIARGKVFMLAGNPGLGKSQITASMAAIVSTGGVWPVDHIHCERGNVVLLSAEDDAEDTIRPRLEAAGADLSRIYILDAVTTGYSSDGQVLQRTFNLQSDLDRLGELIEKIGGAALIVIDPITVYLGSSDSHKNAEIRALLAPLSVLAAKHSAAVVCVSHLNKSGNGEALTRVTGSLAFVAAARAAFLVAKDPENDTRRLFLPLKNNIGKDHTGLAFSVQSAQVTSPAGLIETSYVVWESEAVTVTADEAMVPLGDPEERGVMDDAKDFLTRLLVRGQVPSKQIRADAEGAGYSWRTIQRAQKALGIEAIKVSMEDGWVWKLPPKNASVTEERHTNNVEAFDDLGALQPSNDGTDRIEVEI